jgi:hypothetical protein
MGNSPGDDSITWVRRTHEALLALNVGFAAAFAVATFSYSGVGPHGSMAFFFLVPGWRMFAYCSIAINRLLRLDSLNAVGREIAFVASILIISMVILFVLQAITRTNSIRIILNPVGFVLAVAVAPAFWLYALQASWVADSAVYPFWRSGQLALFAIEVPLLCAFFFLTRKSSIPGWCRALILLIHYMLWTSIMWPLARLPLWSARLFFVVFPCSGFAWLLYVMLLRKESSAGQFETKNELNIGSK